MNQDELLLEELRLGVLGMELELVTTRSVGNPVSWLTYP